MWLKNTVIHKISFCFLFNLFIWLRSQRFYLNPLAEGFCAPSYVVGGGVSGKRPRPPGPPQDTVFVKSKRSSMYETKKSFYNKTRFFFSLSYLLQRTSIFVGGSGEAEDPPGRCPTIFSIHRALSRHCADSEDKRIFWGGGTPLLL